MSDRASTSGAVHPEVRVRLPRRAVALAAATLGLSWATLALTAPAILRLPGETAAGLWPRGIGLAVASAALAAGAAALEARRHRWLLRALSIGGHGVRAEDVERVAALPRRVTVWVLSIGAVAGAAIAVSPLRPPQLDGPRAVSLAILSCMLTAAASVALVALLRGAVSEVLEVAPLEVVRAIVDRIPVARRGRLRGQARLVASIVVPVGLAGLGASLATHAHLRASTEASREATAELLVRAALAPGGTDEAVRASLAAARERGYEVSLAPASRDPAPRRDHDGRPIVTVPLGERTATVVVDASAPPRAGLIAAAVALAGVLLAAGLATLLARELSRDLLGAARRIASLGVGLPPGAEPPAGWARFEVISDLERATSGLAERFRVFASAQERALEAREAARRTRGLLFASVSHDLKSPLNAILGFADLIDAMDLTPDQRESISIVRTRGRELLGLIETILDAARVEAGQLALVKQPTPVHELLDEALRSATQLEGANGQPALEVDPGLPDVPADPIYACRALGAIIAHALKASPDGGVVVRASRPSAADELRIDVVHGAPAPPSARERLDMLAHRSGPRGRGMALALSLAKRVLELHGGQVSVVDGGGGSFGAGEADLPVVKCVLPLSRDAAPRPSSNTIPPLPLSPRVPPR